MAKVATENKIQIGELLLRRGVITAEQIEDILDEQSRKGHKKLFGELLVEKGFCTENQILSALAEVYNVPYASVSPKICDPKVIDCLPRDFLKSIQYCLFSGF